MFFLLRAAFWLSLMLLVLPLGGGAAPDQRDRASLDALSALAAAGATVSDVGGFCGRQPDACAVGAQALKVVGERASVGATMIGDYLGAGAPKPKPVAEPAAPSRDTLTPVDRKPPWRGAAGRQA
jgi:uncharacterized protein DUF5330